MSFPDPRQDMVDSMQRLLSRLEADQQADDAGKISDDQFLTDHPDVHSTGSWDTDAAREKWRAERAEWIKNLQVRIVELGPAPLTGLFPELQPDKGGGGEESPDTGHY